MLLLLLLPLHFFPHLLLHDGDVVPGDITLLMGCERLSSTSWLYRSLNIFDLKLLCRGRQIDAGYALPVHNYLQDLRDVWSLFRIGHQQNPDQVPHLFGNPIVVLVRHEILRIEDSYFLNVLERVHEKAEGEEDTAEHPDICLGVDDVFHVLVDHFGRPVHHSGVLLKIFHHIIKMIGRALRWIKRLGTR